MDLAASSIALHEPQNRLYESRLLIELLRRFRHKIDLYPGLYTANGLDKIRTVRQFDERVVARYGGFTGADDYYYSVASSNWAQDIAVPALILHALDDPFIRMTPDTRAKLVANPASCWSRPGRRPLRLSLARARRRRLLGGENAPGLSDRNGRGLTVEFDGKLYRELTYSGFVRPPGVDRGRHTLMFFAKPSSAKSWMPQ
ncbi:MAG: hypothetical protein WA419_11485 [Silvibacterium sp.]